VIDVPMIRFAKSEDVHIAYQVVGGGPVDLVWIHDWISNLEIMWELPAYERLLNRLASFSRLLLFDKRGTGLSDRLVDLDLFTLDVRMDDVRAVMDATGSREAVIFGHGDDGAALAATFAATHPERTRGLILYGARPVDVSEDDAMSYDPGDVAIWNSEAENFWATDAFARRWLNALAPSIAHDDQAVRWYSRLLRQSASPGTEIAFESTVNDLRPVLAAIHVPTLVLHRSGDRDVPVAGGRELAARIDGARFVEVSGIDASPWAGDPDPIVDEIEDFVRGSRAPTAGERMLATVSFTDIVGSTTVSAELGDSAWGSVLEQHHTIVRGLLARHRGQEIDTAGDGFFATFDGPARAVKCAIALAEAIKTLGIEIRAGVHTGEVETIDGKAGGMAVVIGARIQAIAAPSEVLTSQTVKDLTVGSGIQFEDHGEHELKGVPARWNLYRAIG
jgi:class 3 adenylate cyclase